MTGTNLELLIGLLVVTIPLVALARRANISYPIVLVLGGLVLGFIPKLPPVQLDPNLVLLIFLPPLLYWEGITAPTDVMRANAGQIALLAVGLVIATTMAVAAVAHALVAGMSWGVAVVLGAIVSPTDELAAAPVLDRMRLPRYLIAVVEGESLLNDATALVIYGAAVTAVTTGAFDPGQTALRFLVDAVGALAIGYVTGRLAVEGWRRVEDVQLQNVISVVLPFLAYVPAQHFGFSGVLAVVTAAVYVNRYTPRVVVAEARIAAIGFWDTLVFLINAVLFLMLGLQLHQVAATTFQQTAWHVVIEHALAITAVILVVRFAWVLAAEYIPLQLTEAAHAEPAPKHALIEAWSGLRGAVSLAAALALPEIPHRDFIIVVTFMVILVTLVGGGLTLPWLVRALRVDETVDEERDERRQAYARITAAAIDRIGELEADGRIDAAHGRDLRRFYQHRHDYPAKHADVAQEIVAAQRAALIEMRDRGLIDNVVLRDVQSGLDRAETGIRVRR
jgi:CPA1 family monovalent cation:H+ antiporter